MTLARTLRTALRALFRNITRSALTVLGIVIGIAAVIAMMEIGKGSSGSIARTIASMGANNLLVLPGAAATGGVSFGGGSSLTLTPDDCAAILKDCSSVAAAAPIVRANNPQAIFGDVNYIPLSVVGTTPLFLNVREWTNLADGDCFTDGDVRNAARVCLVGQTIAKQLFGGRPPVGLEFRLQSISFRVVGVLSTKGANTFGQDQDDIIVAPWTTIKFRLQSGGGNTPNTSSTQSSAATSGSIFPGGGSLFPPLSTSGGMTSTARFINVGQILVSATAPTQIQPAIAQITELLRERHRIRPGEPEDFQIRNMTESADALRSTTSMMTNLLLTVALISLVVGGVGIMNIMLVSVTERTREIGLRMAVGARSRDILLQFLTEATLLCLAGGIMGLATGRGTALLVKKLANWPVEPSMEAIIASIAVSVVVGIVFGFYPAWKASRLDPIEALRYE